MPGSCMARLLVLCASFGLFHLQGGVEQIDVCRASLHKPADLSGVSLLLGASLIRGQQPAGASKHPLKGGSLSRQAYRPQTLQGKRQQHLALCPLELKAEKPELVALCLYLMNALQPSKPSEKRLCRVACMTRSFMPNRASGNGSRNMIRLSKIDYCKMLPSAAARLALAAPEPMQAQSMLSMQSSCLTSQHE